MSAFDWDDLRFFLAVARAGRLTAAARQLEADHTTVSRRISRPGRCAQGQAVRAPAAGLRPDRAGRAASRQGREHGDPGAGGGERDRRRRPRARRAPCASARRTVSAPISSRPSSGALAERHPGLTLQLVALPRTFSLSKREADIADHPGAADGRASRVAQAHRLPPQALCLAGLSRPHGPDREPSDLAGKTLVTYVADLLYSPVLDYFSTLEKYTARRFECASVVAQVEAVRAGRRHRRAARLRGAASSRNLQVVLPEISYRAHLLARDACGGAHAAPRARRSIPSSWAG